LAEIHRWRKSTKQQIAAGPAQFMGRAAEILSSQSCGFLLSYSKQRFEPLLHSIFHPAGIA
jgi:hypothetical protein